VVPVELMLGHLPINTRPEGAVLTVEPRFHKNLFPEISLQDASLTNPTFTSNESDSKTFQVDKGEAQQFTWINKR